MTVREEALSRLEAALGYRFRDRELLAQALRHSSAAHQSQAPSFERLEFLGDAALSHAVAALLFERWPGASEGQLTRARAALVRERTLAPLAQKLGLSPALELGSGLEAEDAGPSLLADALESLLGAILLDGGWRALRTVTHRLMAPLLAELQPADLPLEEPKSTLQELAQRQGLPLPIYREVEVRGPAHRRTFVYEVTFDGRALAHGEGSSKRSAQQEAARAALRALAT